MKPARPNITAKQIIDLLSRKHAEDVFVPECKDGPTQSGSHMRLDGWAMKRSWSNPLVIGYEVKVSRSDFLRDDKWPGYLPCCNQLYFVAPRGLIAATELSPEVGLIEVASTGGALLTKKKAAHREVQIPESVWRYILMCRARICRVNGLETSRERRVQEWKDWMAEKSETRQLGYRVSYEVASHVQRVNSENKALKEKMDGYDDVRQTLEALGVRDRTWDVAREVKWKVEELQKAVPPELTIALKTVIESGQVLHSFLQTAEVK